jgi:hypothetical protein
MQAISKLVFVVVVLIIFPLVNVQDQACATMVIIQLLVTIAWDIVQVSATTAVAIITS